MMFEEIARDCQCEQWPDRSRGGQHVGTGPHGVKMTHQPTGIVVCVDVGRTQHHNWALAVDMIAAALTHPSFARWAR